MSLANRVISAARSAWYGATEPAKLWMGRRAANDGLPGGWWRRGAPLVSVIIPTHNRWRLLTERCLPSVLSQTYANLEVVVCAHGCNDETALMLDGWPLVDSDAELAMVLDPRIKWLNVPRKPKYPPTPENHWFAGPVDPINAGLKAATGQWIARIDDDDTWTPDHIEALLRFAQEGDYEFVSAAHATDKGSVQPYIENGIAVGGVQTWLYRSYLRTFTANPDCWRKTWCRVNDTDLQDRFIKAGVRMGYLDKVVAHVLPRPGETEIGLKAYTADADKTKRLLAFPATS